MCFSTHKLSASLGCLLRQRVCTPNAQLVSAEALRCTRRNRRPRADADLRCLEALMHTYGSIMALSILSAAVYHSMTALVVPLKPTAPVQTRMRVVRTYAPSHDLTLYPTKGQRIGTMRQLGVCGLSERTLRSGTFQPRLESGGCIAERCRCSRPRQQLPFKGPGSPRKGSTCSGWVLLPGSMRAVQQ